MRPLCVAAVGLALCGCPGPSEDKNPPVDSQLHPVIPGNAVVLLRDPHAGSRAAGVQVMQVNSDQAVRAVIRIDDGEGHRRVLRPRGSGNRWNAPLIGFRADRRYDVEVQLTSLDGALFVGEPHLFRVRTPPLDPLLPTITLTKSTPEPRGDTLFGAQAFGLAFWLIRVDGDGEIVWYLRTDGTTLDLRELPDGRLLFDDNGEVVYSDWANEVEAHIRAEAPLIDFHHEVAPRPEGGFFALSRQHVQVDDFPIDDTVPCGPGGPATILDTVVTEFDDAGTLVQSWSMAERMDTHHVGFGSFAPDQGAADWAHGNALVYQPEHDSFLVSMRSQDAIVEMSRATGELKWILSPPGNWGPQWEALRLQPLTPGFQWPYHAHAVEPQGDQLLIFDNGNAQDSPCGDGPSGFPIANRVVELQVDREARTVQETSAWTTGLFSAVMGDADRIEGNRVLVTHGQLTSDEQGSLANRGLGVRGARIQELDRTSNQVVWQLEITGEAAVAPEGWSVPRAERLEH